MTKAGSAGRAGVSWASNFFSAHRKLVITLVVIFASFVMLYGPACDYYEAWREGLDLQATYDASVQSNEQLTEDVNTLTTTEGIEDLARKRGYVEDGETGVVVEGLEEDDQTTEVVGSGDVVSAEVPWYISALDFIFGYEGQS